MSSSSHDEVHALSLEASSNNNDSSHPNMNIIDAIKEASAYKAVDSESDSVIGSRSPQKHEEDKPLKTSTLEKLSKSKLRTSRSDRDASREVQGKSRQKRGAGTKAREIRLLDKKYDQMMCKYKVCLALFILLHY